jgi:hypothetical protein
MVIVVFLPAKVVYGDMWSHELPRLISYVYVSAGQGVSFGCKEHEYV